MAKMLYSPFCIPRVIFLWQPSPSALCYFSRLLCVCLRCPSEFLILGLPSSLEKCSPEPKQPPSALCCRKFFHLAGGCTGQCGQETFLLAVVFPPGPQPSLRGKTIFFKTAHKKWKWSVISWNGCCPSQSFRSSRQNSVHLTLLVIQNVVVNLLLFWGAASGWTSDTSGDSLNWHKKKTRVQTGLKKLNRESCEWHSVAESLRLEKSLKGESSH